MTTCPLCSDPRSFSTLHDMDEVLTSELDSMLQGHDFSCWEEANAFEIHCQSKLQAAICEKHRGARRWLQGEEGAR